MHDKFDHMFKTTTDHFFCTYDQKFCDGEIIDNEIIVKPELHRIMDIIYKLEDGYHNFEFQTGKLKTKDLIRFNLYQSMIMDKYKTENVKTTIIYTEKINKKTLNKIKQSRYDMNIISLKDHNGDKILNNIKSKIKNNKKITQKDECNLAYLPLYQTETKPKDILYEVCLLTNQITQIPQENIGYIKKTYLMLVEILIKNNKEKEKYIEAIKMKSQVIDMLIEQGEQKGLKKGIKEGLIKGEQKGLKEGIKEGIEIGKEYGREEGVRDITRNMLRENISIDNIIRITGLSKEEIEKIQ